MRKTYSAEFKGKVALEAIAGQRSLAELASRHEVHPNLIRQWRKTLVEGLPQLFSDRRRRQEENTEAEKARLFEEIGRLKVELDWAKKNHGLLRR